MKTLVCLPLLGLLFGVVSCRTNLPLDPMNMEPSTRCLPGQPVTGVVEPTK